jgi:hypothetical protein
MSTALSRHSAPRRSLRDRHIAVGLSALATAGIIFALGLAPGPRSGSEDERADIAPATAFPGTLTRSERAAVAAALTAGDPRIRLIAREVAAGRAGASALADPAILHHHQLDTSRATAATAGRLAADRFHHR